MIHGGDTLTYQEYYEGELVDFSSNINPLGPPDGLRELIYDNFHLVESYPDIKYRRIKESLADYLGCGPENILVGNGAMEIIDLFNFNARRVITTTPAFSEYSLRGRVYGKEVIELSYGEDGLLDIQAFRELLKEDDLIIIGNPNNPTGLREDKDSLLELYDLVKERKAYLLLDEAFFEFVPEDYDSIQVFKEAGYERIGIIRAATKFFALPGLRLGYGCFHPDLVEELESRRLTWSLNCFADLAGQFIFKDKDYIKRSKEYINRERLFMLEELKKIPGLKVYESLTNYILLELENKKEDEVFKALLSKGLLVRKCSSYISLADNHIRVAVKDRENNERLIKALNEIDL